VSHFHFCASALPGFLLPVIYSPTVQWTSLLRLFVSGQRLWLLPPGLGLAVCLPLVVEFLLRIPCCSILGCCHPMLVVIVASKFNRNLVDSITSASVRSRFWLLPPGLGLADSLPPVFKSLQILCCSISGSCYPKHVVFVASKLNRSLVRGTRTNSTCTRSGLCNANIRLLFLDAYYCQSIARNSSPSFRDQQSFVQSCSPSRSRSGRVRGFTMGRPPDPGPPCVPAPTLQGPSCGAYPVCPPGRGRAPGHHHHPPGGGAVFAPLCKHVAPPPGLYPAGDPRPRRFASRAPWARLGFPVSLPSTRVAAAPGGVRPLSAPQARGAAAGALPGARPASQPLRFSGPRGPGSDSPSLPTDLRVALRARGPAGPAATPSPLRRRYAAAPSFGCDHLRGGTCAPPPVATSPPPLVGGAVTPRTLSLHPASNDQSALCLKCGAPRPPPAGRPSHGHGRNRAKLNDVVDIQMNFKL
jgi:hypothetical protein